MLQQNIPHDLMQSTLAIGGLLIGLVQALTFYILQDIRNRLVRLEDLAIKGQPE